MDVQLTVDPGLRLPRDLDLAAYRIVQEALTNALKHAAPCAADGGGQAGGDGSVIIRGLRHRTRRRERDRRRSRSARYRRTGVACRGGTLEHGNGQDGGFRLRAVLPLP